MSHQYALPRATLVNFNEEPVDVVNSNFYKVNYTLHLNIGYRMKHHADTLKTNLHDVCLLLIAEKLYTLSFLYLYFSVFVSCIFIF